jgi:hypothetical protein
MFEQLLAPIRRFVRRGKPIHFSSTETSHAQRLVFALRALSAVPLLSAEYR